MRLSTAQSLLVAAIGFYLTLIAFNNLTDYGSNYAFVEHVLRMDTTFPDNRGMWRAIDSPAVHTLFYWIIIAWETAAAVCCWIGAAALWRRGTTRYAVLGLTLSMLLWLSAFLTVGGEWFLMWQSATWNGQSGAFRMFTVSALVLLIVFVREAPRE
jgi:Predicted small integral membrane protein